MAPFSSDADPIKRSYSYAYGDTFPMENLKIFKVTESVSLETAKKEIKKEVETITAEFFKILCDQRTGLIYDPTFVRAIVQNYNSKIETSTVSELVNLYKPDRFRGHLIRAALSYIVHTQSERIDTLEARLNITKQAHPSFISNITKMRAPESIYELFGLLAFLLTIFLLF